MKNYIFFIIAVVLLIVSVVCYNLIVEHKQKNKQMQAVKQVEESTQVKKQEDKYLKKEEISYSKKDWDDMTAEEQEAIRNKYLSKFNFNQKYTLKAINDELGMLFEDWNNCDTCRFYVAGSCEYFRYYVLEPLIRKRVELHLKNPITFYNNLPRIDSLIKILKTPDGKCKLYNFDVQAGGNNINYATYIQYKNHSGKITFYQYESGFDVNGFCDTIFQFNSKGKNYYMIHLADKWSGILNIFSIDNGVLAWHNEFFPDDESRKLERWKQEVAFDPATKAVSTTSDDDNGKEIIKQYKLVEPK